MAGFDINNKGAGDFGRRMNNIIKHKNERGDTNIIGTSYDHYGIGNEKRTISTYFKDQTPKGYKMPKSSRGVYAEDIHHANGVSYGNYYNKSSINRPNYTENKNFRISDKKGYKINIGNKWS